MNKDAKLIEVIGRLAASGVLHHIRTRYPEAYKHLTRACLLNIQTRIASSLRQAHDALEGDAKAGERLVKLASEIREAEKATPVEIKKLNACIKEITKQRDDLANGARVLGLNFAKERVDLQAANASLHYELMQSRATIKALTNTSRQVRAERDAARDMLKGRRSA